MSQQQPQRGTPWRGTAGTPRRPPSSQDARRRRQEERQTDQRAKAAFDDLSAQIKSWSSPMLAEQQQQQQASSSSSYSYYQSDEVAWMRETIQEEGQGQEQDYDDYYQQHEEDIDMQPNDDEEGTPQATTATSTMTAATPKPKRSPMDDKTTDRATTPVMSNARRRRGVGVHPSQEETPAIPHNVQSPYYQQQEEYYQESSAHRTTTTTTAAAVVPSLSRLYIQQCMQYHDALVQYVQDKRRLADRMDLSRQAEQQALVGNDAAPAELQEEEYRIESSLLRQLGSLAYDRAASSYNTGTRSVSSSSLLARKEGNFWMLLSKLRALGMDALVWDNEDERRYHHQANTLVQQYKDSLASRVDATPLELVQALSQDGPPILQRRQQILAWLEQDCFRRLVPAGATRPRLHTNTVPQSELLSTQALVETDQDAEILRVSLSLILAGRLEDAKRLVRESGLAWRAALWSGGSPHGYEMKKDVAGTTTTKVAVGNTRRPLWKRLIWKQAENLAQDPKASNKEEAAISSILSNNIKVSLDNASLRSWEKGLYVSMRAVLGRLEDEVLHAHNNNRRQVRPPYPGTEFAKQERDHLVATADVAPLDEAGIVATLDRSPFVEMRNDDALTTATAAFLVGKTFVVAFMESSMDLLEESKHNDDQDSEATTLRFMAHLALYMDSLTNCSAPLNIPQISAWKNEMVLQWVNHLALREELWRLVVLYVSLLPEDTILENLPILLTGIESPQQRSIIVQQMRDFLPTADLDRMVLQQVVTLVLKEPDDDAAMTFSTGDGIGDDDDDAPSYADERKMRAILWLCQNEDHLGDALIFSNTLLRQFLLSDRKLKSAFVFIDDIRPQQVLDLANGSIGGEGQEVESTHGDDGDEEGQQEYSSQVQQARWEHLAFQSYLDAEKDVVNWQEVLDSSDTCVVIEDGIDLTQLNATEAAIAKSTEQRQVTEMKRERSSNVVSAADDALQGLTRVLQHPGGWLFIEPEDMAQDEEQDQERYNELHQLRVKLLPKVAMRYLEVCADTAAWLSASLDDGIVQLNASDPNAVLAALDDGVARVAVPSPVAPVYWTRKALQLVDGLTSETMTVAGACGVNEMKDILSKVADITVAHLKYSTSLGASPDF